jgi:hypothetical protein
METINVLIGKKVVGSGGLTQDDLREVEFKGELLAQNRQVGEHRGNVSDTRGTIERLYRTDIGQLFVHIESWSRWQGEPTSYSLCEVNEEDLGPIGQFWQLGADAGFGRPLTLEEALQSG